MPMGLVKTDREEELWSKAKAAAKKQGHTEDWAYINGIYQRMKGHKKSASLMEPLVKKGNDMSKRGSLLDSLFKTAGKVPGVPDATGPYGRGEGPGKGTKSGLGLVMAKMERGEELTEEEKAILETARGKIKK